MSHDTYELKAEAREQVGKGSAREVRRNGKVPAVIYGDKQPPLPIALSYKDVYYKIHGGGFLTTVATIDVGGQKIQVLPKDYQLDPVRDFSAREAMATRAFWYIALGHGAAAQRSEIAPRVRLGEPLAPQLGAREQAGNHLGRQLGRREIDERRREDLDQREEARIREVARGEGRAQLGPQHR